MKKNYLLLTIVLLLASNFTWAQSTETFETETPGGVTFTNAGQVFEISSWQPFGIASSPGTGWNGAESDDVFIDNHLSAMPGQQCLLTIKSQGGTPFTLKSLWVYMNYLNASGPRTLTFFGVLGNLQKFSVTQAIDWESQPMTQEGAFKEIDFASFGGSDSSNILIDQVVIITTSGYLAIDAITWECAAPNITGLSYVNVTCNGAADGAATVSVMGSNLTYDWAPGNPAGDGTASVNSLAPGTYTCTVRNVCSAPVVVTVTISEPDAVAVAMSATAPVCYNTATGTASALPSGGTPPYSYNWSNGSTDASIGGLTAGIYNVTVTDDNGCVTSGVVTVGENQPLAVTFNITHNYCYGSADGSAMSTVTGGSGDYSYQWSDGTTGPNLEYAVAGIYNVIVTDNQGCGSISETITINEPQTEMTGYVIALPIQCYGGTTTGSTVVSGGTPPYTYAWPNGETTPEATNIPAGFHNVFITDANGCDLIATYFLSQAPVTAITAETQVITNAVCHDGNEGVAQVNVSGGTAPYMYNWVPFGGNSAMATGLSAGDYTVTITDAKGCMAEATVTITEPDAMIADIVVTDATCDGSGSAMVNISGGVAPFTYLWSNGSTSASVTGLASGMHSVTVTDANGCTTTNEFNVDAPAAITGYITSAAATCYGTATGTAQVVIEGEGVYTYLWSNGATTSAVNNLATGNYTVTVTAQSGCTVTFSTFIGQPPAMDLTVTVEGPLCFGDTGSAFLSVGDYPGIVNVLWPDGSTGDGATGLEPGDYVVTVTNQQGCTFTEAFTVGQAPQALFAEALFNNVGCHGGNAQATVSVAGGTAPYSYYWSGGTELYGTSQVVVLPAGTYTLLVTDANGCVAENNFTIQQPAAPLSATAELIAAISCFGGNDGTAKVTATGGTSSYMYSWSSGATTDTVTGLAAGTYTVTVTDSNNCSAIASVTITAPAAIANDECAGALDVSFGTSAGTNVCASQSVNALPSCAATAYDSWYKFNSGSNTSVSLNINMGYDIYSGSCNALTQVDCSTGGLSVFAVSANTVYYIRAFATTPASRAAFSIALASACTPPTNLVVTNDAATVFASWTAPSPEPINGYQFEIRTSGAPGSGTVGRALTGGSTPNWTTINGLAVNSSYTMYIRSNCGNGTYSDWSAGVPFTTGYCTPMPSSGNGIGITSVKFDTVNNTTGAEAGHYGNYSAMYGMAQRANNLTVNVTTNVQSYVKIWVDWNNDFDFNDSGEEVYSSAGVTNYTAGTFTIPATVISGNHRMRIGSSTASSLVPCYTGSSASFEDYTLYIDPLGPAHLNDNACNVIIDNFNKGLYVNNIANVQSYRFRVRNAGNEQVITRTSPYITLNMLTAPAYGVTYTIDVTVMINGTWTDYGKACTVTTSDSVSSLELCEDGGTAIESFAAPVYARYVPLATNYRFQVTSPTGTVVVDRPNRYFMMNLIPGHDYNVDYSVRVAMFINGGWTDYGSACTVRVNIPILTLRSTYCNASVPKKTTAIYANNCPNAVTWYFRVTVNGIPYTVVRNVGYFFLSSVPATINPGQTVGVEVKVFSVGAESAWGAMCNVTLAGTTGRPGNTVGATSEPVINLKAFPNPFTETFALEFDSQSQEMVNITVYDMTGKLVDTRETTVGELPDLKFGDSLAAGVYNLILTQGETIKTLRVVKNVN
ncbi:MAG: GEVED domain-containing protein [Flavobacterium sp.]